MQRMQREALQQTAQQVTQRDERCRAPTFALQCVRAAFKHSKAKIASSQKPATNGPPSSENLLREGRSHRCEERWCLEADAFQDGRLAGAEAGEHAKRGPDGTPDGTRHA